LTATWLAPRRPTLWLGTDKPRGLATPAAEENALASGKPAEPKEAATNLVRAVIPAFVTPVGDLPPVWKEIRRVEARQYPEADGVTLRRRLSYTLGSNPAIAAGA